MPSPMRLYCWRTMPVDPLTTPGSGIDRIVAAAGVARRLFLVLEGSNTAAALLDTQTALADTRTVVDTLLATARSEVQ